MSQVVHDRLRQMECLRHWRFVAGSERALQEGVEACLLRSGERFVREAILSPRSRVDFLTEDGIAIELKVEGTVGDIVCQLQRYAGFDAVLGLVLVSTHRAHVGLADLETVGGKPFRLVLLAAEAAL